MIDFKKVTGSNLNAKDRLVLTSDKSKWLIMFGVSIILFLVGLTYLSKYSAVPFHEQGDMYGFIFFLTIIVSAPLILSFVNLVTGVSRLELDKHGFRWRSIFFHRQYFTDFSWNEVKNFRVTRWGYIVFDVDKNSNYKKSAGQILPIGLRVAMGLTGDRGALPDSYGMSPKKISEFLNESRNKFVDMSP